jgi:hypothetical protein
MKITKVDLIRDVLLPEFGKIYAKAKSARKGRNCEFPIYHNEMMESQNE